MVALVAAVTEQQVGVVLALAIAKFVLLNVIVGLGLHEVVFPITAAFYRSQWWSILRRGATLGCGWSAGL